MRFRQCVLFVLFGLLCSLPLAAQQPVPRDPRVLGILVQSLATMGGTVPRDSVATGTVVLVAGSLTETGTVRILIRGVDQSAALVQTQDRSRQDTYSRGLASLKEGSSTKALSLELATSSQWPGFPLILIAAALNNPDIAFQYVGLETLDGLGVHHVRFWNTYASNLRLKHLTDFSVKDLWIDAASGLPVKLSFERRAAGGSEPRIPMEVFYSDYRNVSGVLYPFLIKKSLNGTPWATITIVNVAFNTGLTEADFAVQ